MQTQLTNPYQALKPINDPRMFFGPASVVRRIYSALEGDHSVSLVGLRHAGKTTLLRCMSHPAIQQQYGYDLSRHFFVYIDVRNWLRKSCDDFFDIVSTAIIAASRGRLNYLTLPARSGGDRYRAVLEQVKEQGFHTVLQLDAFDDITRNPAFDPEFFMFLRAQASEGLLSYITASIAPLNQICHPAIKGSPFFNIFAVRPIEPLAQSEGRDLVLVPSRQAACAFTEEEAEWVMKLAGRHPFFIQRVCYYLFEEKSQHRASGVNKRRVARQAYDELSSHFAYIWEELNPDQQAFLKEEAQRKGFLERQMPELSESSLYRQFVRHTCHLSFFHMDVDDVIAELRETLKQLDKPGVLGNSMLRHFKLVLARLEHIEEAPSTFEKGLAVREVLNAALEKMKGSGVRADYDQAWRLYNVLYYTYFKKINANQEQIAARINVSYRHYHRVKDDAIIALANILLEMEATCNAEYDE